MKRKDGQTVNMPLRLSEAAAESDWLYYLKFLHRLFHRMRAVDLV